MSGNRIRTCVRRHGYEPDELLKFKIKKAPDFSEAFVSQQREAFNYLTSFLKITMILQHAHLNDYNKKYNTYHIYLTNLSSFELFLKHINKLGAIIQFWLIGLMENCFCIWNDLEDPKNRLNLFLNRCSNIRCCQNRLINKQSKLIRK